TTDTVNITTSPLTLDLGANRELCGRPGDVVDLNGTTPGAISYQWSGAVTVSTPMVRTTNPGTYILEVRDALGCTATDRVTVTRRQTPYLGDFTTVPANRNQRFGDPIEFRASAPVGTNSITWDLGDGNTGSGSPYTHIYAAIDTYDVRLFVSDGVCSDTIMKDVGVRPAVIAIDNQLNVDMAVIPNPTEGRFALKLDWEVSAGATVTVRDLQGREIETRVLSEARNHYEIFDMSNQAKGMYFLHIRSGEGEAVSKVLLH
ncbi:MAG: T9SS type A sorting domain-containing protein, partial [Bacteroidia bacterium]